MPEPVALLAASSYQLPDLREKVFRLLDCAGPHVTPGLRVLVKPNLLMAHELACTSPQVTALACEWLLERGARVMVADSPAFGTAPAVAAAIGLAAALRPLSLHVQGFSKTARIRLNLPDGKKPETGIAREALESDLILSVPRVKAHSQLRITLGVKNCYGCIRGIRKAWYHARFGENTDFFADCVAALFAGLPPVACLCDGIVAMNRTGPRNGSPFALGLLAASLSAPALDSAILQVLGLDPAEIPLPGALQKRGIPCEPGGYPLATPQELAVNGFEVPATLKPVSFNPGRLGLSILKRLWLDFRKKS